MVKRLRHRPFTAVTRVRFPSESFNTAYWLSWLERRPVTAEVVGSNPIRVVCMILSYENYIYYGILAQLGEHLPYKQRVIGSSPIGPILLSFD